MHPFEYYLISFLCILLVIVSTIVFLIRCLMPLVKLSCKRMSLRKSSKTPGILTEISYSKGLWVCLSFPCFLPFFPCKCPLQIMTSGGILFCAMSLACHRNEKVCQTPEGIASFWGAFHVCRNIMKSGEMKHERSLFHIMVPNRNVLSLIHLLFVTTYGLVQPSFNIR